MHLVVYRFSVSILSLEFIEPFCPNPAFSVVSSVIALSAFVMSLTPHEQMELQRLLNKAKVAASENLGPDEFVLIPAQEMPGAMSDGSKRRDPDSTEGGRGKKQMSSYAGPSSSGVVPAPVPLGSLDVLTLPSPSSTEKMSQVELPPDVPDVETWSRTLVTFGKHAVRKLTYAQFMSSTETELVGYRKWAYDRRNTCTGLMRDFTNYMVYCETHEAGSLSAQAPIIPGTNTVRRYG